MRTNPPVRLSIIIATRNAASTLQRCMDSIFAQTFVDFELIIVDGASRDGTREIIEACADRLAYWHSRPDIGIYDAWNQALVHASGEYVCFLGADDALHAPDTLADIFSAIGDHSFDLVSSRANLRDSAFRLKKTIGHGFEFSGLPRRMTLVHPGLLHRRVLFDRYGLFNTRYRIAADLDFLLRLPSDTAALHLHQVTVEIQDDGICRRQFWARIWERREVHKRCPRVGSLRANLFWADKAWRRPVARLFGLPH